MSANDRQVGGAHYRAKGGERHWDRLVRQHGLDRAYTYFVGNATAYAERYREKNGIEDLSKAIHYLEKLVELERAHAAGKCPCCAGYQPAGTSPPSPDDQGKNVPSAPVSPAKCSTCGWCTKLLVWGHDGVSTLCWNCYSREVAEKNSKARCKYRPVGDSDDGPAYPCGIADCAYCTAQEGLWDLGADSTPVASHPVTSPMDGSLPAKVEVPADTSQQQGPPSRRKDTGCTICQDPDCKDPGGKH